MAEASAGDSSVKSLLSIRGSRESLAVGHASSDESGEGCEQKVSKNIDSLCDLNSSRIQTTVGYLEQSGIGILGISGDSEQVTDYNEGHMSSFVDSYADERSNGGNSSGTGLSRDEGVPRNSQKSQLPKDAIVTITSETMHVSELLKAQQLIHDSKSIEVRKNEENSMFMSDLSSCENLERSASNAGDAFGDIEGNKVNVSSNRVTDLLASDTHSLYLRRNGVNAVSGRDIASCSNVHKNEVHASGLSSETERDRTNTTRRTVANVENMNAYNVSMQRNGANLELGDDLTPYSSVDRNEVHYESDTFDEIEGPTVSMASNKRAKLSRMNACKLSVQRNGVNLEMGDDLVSYSSVERNLVHGVKDTCEEVERVVASMSRDKLSNFSSMNAKKLSVQRNGANLESRGDLAAISSVDGIEMHVSEICSVEGSVRTSISSSRGAEVSASVPYKPAVARNLHNSLLEVAMEVEEVSDVSGTNITSSSILYGREVMQPTASESTGARSGVGASELHHSEASHVLVGNMRRVGVVAPVVNCSESNSQTAMSVDMNPSEEGDWKRELLNRSNAVRANKVHLENKENQRVFRELSDIADIYMRSINKCCQECGELLTVNEIIGFFPPLPTIPLKSALWLYCSECDKYDCSDIVSIASPPEVEGRLSNSRSGGKKKQSNDNVGGATEAEKYFEKEIQIFESLASKFRCDGCNSIGTLVRNGGVGATTKTGVRRLGLKCNNKSKGCKKSIMMHRALAQVEGGSAIYADLASLYSKLPKVSNSNSHVVPTIIPQLQVPLPTIAKNTNGFSEGDTSSTSGIGADATSTNQLPKDNDVADTSKKRGRDSAVAPDSAEKAFNMNRKRIVIDNSSDDEGDGLMDIEGGVGSSYESPIAGGVMVGDADATSSEIPMDAVTRPDSPDIPECITDATNTVEAVHSVEVVPVAPATLDELSKIIHDLETRMRKMEIRHTYATIDMQMKIDQHAKTESELRRQLEEERAVNTSLNKKFEDKTREVNNLKENMRQAAVPTISSTRNAITSSRVLRSNSKSKPKPVTIVEDSKEPERDGDDSMDVERESAPPAPMDADATRGWGDEAASSSTDEPSTYVPPTSTRGVSSGGRGRGSGSRRVGRGGTRNASASNGTNSQEGVGGTSTPEPRFPNSYAGAAKKATVNSQRAKDVKAAASFAALRPPPENWSKVYILWNPNKKTKMGGRKALIHMAWRFLEAAGINRKVKDISLRGNSLFEAYVAESCLPFVLEGLQRHKYEYKLTLDAENYNNNREQAIFRVGGMLMRHTMVNLRECILSGHEDIKVEVLVKEGEMRARIPRYNDTGTDSSRRRQASL